jgi:hypothetical protein
MIPRSYDVIDTRFDYEMCFSYSKYVDSHKPISMHDRIGGNKN